jgi:IMP dehydrogenase
MAEAIARCGGLAVIPQYIPADVVAEVVAWIKERDPVHDTQLVLPPTGTVGEGLNPLPKPGHGAVAWSTTAYLSVS